MPIEGNLLYNLIAVTYWPEGALIRSIIYVCYRLLDTTFSYISTVHKTFLFNPLCVEFSSYDYTCIDLYSTAKCLV